MILLIILLGLMALGIFIAYKSYKYDILGIFMALVFGCLVLAHCLPFFTKGYHYGLLVEERNAFEQTLNKSREKGSENEAAAIVKEVARWNIKLAKYKYDNKNWFLGQYVDSRIETIEPIE